MGCRMTRTRRALAATAAAAFLTAGLAPPANAGTTTRTWPGVKATVSIPNPAGRTISATTKTTISTPAVTTRVVDVYTFGHRYQPGPDGPDYRLDYKRISHKSWGSVTYTYRTVSDYAAADEDSGLFTGHKYWVFVRVRVYNSKGQLMTTTGTYFYGSRYYDSLTAQWLTQDSFRGVNTDPQTLHRLVSVAN